MVLDTLSQMPSWAQFLIYVPLPMLICALVLRFMLKDDLDSRFQSEREKARNMLWILAILYPLFIALIILATIITVGDELGKLWQRFGKWAQAQPARHRVRMRLKAQLKAAPKSKPQPEYLHMTQIIPKGTRTVCGVGNPSEVRKTITTPEVTCPIYLGLMRDN